MLKNKYKYKVIILNNKRVILLRNILMIIFEITYCH